MIIVILVLVMTISIITICILMIIKKDKKVINKVFGVILIIYLTIIIFICIKIYQTNTDRNYNEIIIYNEQIKM